MSFIEQSLSTGEDIVAVFKLHWINTLPIYFYLLMAVPTLGIALIAAVLHWLKLRKTELAVTNKRVIKKTGIISRRTDEMKITSIETVTLQQSVVGTLLGYGTLLVTGRGVSDVTYSAIRDPMGVKRTIEGVEPDRYERIDEAAEPGVQQNEAII